MTAPVLTTLDPALKPSPDASVPLVRLVDVELRKTVDTRSARWLLGAVAASVAGIVTLLVVWGSDIEVSTASLTRTSVYPVLFILPLVSVLATTGEWTQRGGLTTFTLVPRRGRVVAAKAVAALIVTLATFAFLVLCSAIGSLVAAQARGIDLGWDLDGPLAARLLVLVAGAVAQGFALALLLRASAPAMVAFVAVLLIVPMVSAIVGGYFPWWGENSAWFDPGWPLNLVGVESFSGEQWAQIGTASLLWIVLPLVVGLRRVLRVEIR